MAVKNRADLYSQSDSTFQDSPVGNITPPNHRAFNNDCIDSFANVSESNSFEATQTFNQRVGANRIDMNTITYSVPSDGYCDFVNVNGNFINVTFGGNNIERVDTNSIAIGGEFRYLRFQDSGTIIYNPDKLRCPANQNINVEAGDTCLLVFIEANVGYIFQYQRFSGRPIIDPPNGWYYDFNGNPPVPSNNYTQGFVKAHRWVVPSGRIWECTYIGDALNPDAIWVPMSGKMTHIGGGGDLEFNITSDFDLSSSTAPTCDFTYTKVGNVMRFVGWIEQSEINLTNAHPFGMFKIIFNNVNFANPYYLRFDSAWGIVPVGLGQAIWNNQGAPHKNMITFGGVFDTPDIYTFIRIDTYNPHFGSGGTLRIFADFAIGCNLEL